MKGYKAFDKNLQCIGFQFEVGNTYRHVYELELCGSGFHFCLDLFNCFNYYNFSPDTRICEVDFDEKNVIHGGDKSATKTITIVKEIVWNDLDKHSNQIIVNDDSWKEYKNSKILVWKSKIIARENSSVEAWGNSSVVIPYSTKINIKSVNDNATIKDLSGSKPKLIIANDFEIVKYGG